MIPKPIAYSIRTTTVGETASDATSIEVAAAGAPHFPALGSGEYTYAVLCSDETFSNIAVDYETVKVTGITGTTLTVERNAESTDGAKVWPDGTFIVCPVTAIGWGEIATGLDGKAEEVHDLVDTTNHPVSGLTPGHFLKATAAAAYAFEAHGLSASDVSALPIAGGTMTGELNLADNLLTRPKIKDYGETAVVATDVTGATTIDLEDGNVVQHTLSGAPTYTFSNPPASGTAGSFTLIIIQPATAVAVTWPGSLRWAGGNAPDLSEDTGVYVLTFMTVDAGTNWYGFLAGSDMKAAS